MKRQPQKHSYTGPVLRYSEMDKEERSRGRNWKEKIRQRKEGREGGVDKGDKGTYTEGEKE